MPRVVVALGSMPVLTFELRAGDTSLGSAAGNDVVLPLPDVAERHVTLRVSGGAVEVRPGPGELVLVNGRAFAGGMLGAGDVLVVGPYALRLDGEPAPAPASPESDDLLVSTIGGAQPAAPVRCVRRLLVVQGGDEGLEAYVDGPIATIGRAPDCDLVLHDTRVSWRHAALERGSAGARVRDLGSLNGTFLDGRQVEVAPVAAGSLLTIGESVILLAGVGGAVPDAASRAGALPGLAELVGASEPMQEVYRQLRKAAGSLLPVLLAGETGSGKELAARAVHTLSARANGPFVPLNCAAIPRDIIESELFGHVRGAFTGAVADHRGAFERARGGTLFLDELGELPLELQAKLLRALESGEVTRLGGGLPVRTDARIVAASNRDLERLATDGLFRGDLFYRVAVLRLRLPPLRERRADVAALVHHFLRTVVRDTGVPGADRVRMRQDALDRLERHPWPGNVRELRNVIHRAVVECEGDEITREQVDALLAGAAGAAAPAPGPALTLEDVEQEAVRNALRDTGGNRRAAARRLGIAESTLYEKIRKYRL